MERRLLDSRERLAGRVELGLREPADPLLGGTRLPQGDLRLVVVEGDPLRFLIHHGGVVPAAVTERAVDVGGGTVLTDVSHRPLVVVARLRCHR